MKNGFRIIVRTLGAFALFFACASAQSQSLVFSRVLIVGSVNDTVPAGKVWKIESAMASSDLQIQTNSTSHQSHSVVIEVNGASVYIKSTWGSSYNSVGFESTTLPIWLAAGHRLRASTSCAGVSVIEFSITP